MAAEKGGVGRNRGEAEKEAGRRARREHTNQRARLEGCLRRCEILPQAVRQDKKAAERR